MPTTVTNKKQIPVFTNSLESSEPDIDDEPLTEDELAQLAASEADFAAGRFCTLEEFNREMDELNAR